MPSAVQMRALVVGLKHWPAPPEARMTRLGREGLHPAGADVARHAARTAAFAVDRERGGEPLLVAVHGLVVLHELLVEHVEDRLAGDVGHVVGAGGAGPTEGARAELAALVAVERDADVLQVQELFGRLAAHDLDGVLVAQEVGALHRVVGVGLPGVLGLQRRVDPPGGRHGVRADGVHLAQDRDGRARVGRRQGRPLAGEAGADDEDVVLWHRGSGLYTALPVVEDCPGGVRSSAWTSQR